MIDEINKELLQLEQSHGIKILYAVESGSRAWGFESTDSDWDVRFVYIHHLDWYLQIDNGRDSYDKILPNDIDLAGWELKKALKLFQKSNPALLEWLNSPILYKNEGSFADRLRTLSSEFFNPKACMYHYLQMARGSYHTFEGKHLTKIKKYFYAIRQILACDWINRTNTLPPIVFDELLNTELHDNRVRDIVKELLVKKKAENELGEKPRIPLLDQFLEEKMAFYQEKAKTMDSGKQPPIALLNELFRDLLQESW